MVMDGNWTYCGDYFIIYKNIESLCCTPETSITLYVKYNFKKKITGAALVVQWLRIHLPMQGTQVRALVREDPTCHGATEPRAPQLLSPRATTTEARTPRVRASQQEKPPQ